VVAPCVLEFPNVDYPTAEEDRLILSTFPLDKKLVVGLGRHALLNFLKFNNVDFIDKDGSLDENT